VKVVCQCLRDQQHALAVIKRVSCAECPSYAASGKSLVSLKVEVLTRCVRLWDAEGQVLDHALTDLAETILKVSQVGIFWGTFLQWYLWSFSSNTFERGQQKGPVSVCCQPMSGKNRLLIISNTQDTHEGPNLHHFQRPCPAAQYAGTTCSW
jgi:hypothetical protein